MADDHRYALPAGYRLGDYRIEQVLGHGGFGITYLARDQRLSRLVAIKEFLPTDLAMREDDSTVLPRSTRARADYDWGLQRFLTEARTLARFRHPNIAQVLTLFEANGTAYIVMAYEEGRSLSEHLAECGGTLPAEELLGLIDPLLDGLEAVHQAGFLHRDIKPSNVFLRADNTPVLLDFGTARQAVGSLTRSVAAIMTPGYAPIELYTTRGRQGPWTDIYGFGALLYTCLSGRSPPEASVRSEARMMGEPDPLEPAVVAGQGRYPEALLKAVDWSLALLSKERPQSVAALRHALRTGEIPQPEHRAGDVPSQPAPARGAEPAGEAGREAETPGPRPAKAKRPERNIALWALAAAGGIAVLTVVIFLAEWRASAPNRPPVVEADRTLTVAGNAAVPLDIKRPTDLDGDPLQVTVTQLPALGTVQSGSQAVRSGQTLTVDALTSLTYTPAPGPAGSAGTFRYRVDDGHGGVVTRSLVIETRPPGRRRSGPNQQPVVQAGCTIEVATGAAGPVPLQIVPPSDPDGDPLTIRVVAVPDRGRILRGSGGAPVQRDQLLNADELAALVYQPEPGQVGRAGQFRYDVDDGHGGSASSWVEIQAGPPAEAGFNRQPAGEPERELRVPVNSEPVPLGVRPPTDPDGDVLTIQVTQVPGLGTILDGTRPVRIGEQLSVAQLTALAVRPNPNREGDAGWFRYLVADPNSGRVETGVRIEILPGTLTPDQLRSLEADLSTEEKQQVQKWLQSLGYYNGVVDGSFGERTRNGIHTFQQTLGVEPTGYLTDSQRARLRDAAAAGSLTELAALETSWNQQERARVQRALELLGHYAGPRNGTFDAATRDAMRAFQASIRAAQTGYLTREQRLALAVAAAEAAAQRAEDAAYAAQLMAARARSAAAAPNASTVPYPDGAIYRGEMRGETRHGVGVMTWPDGRRYEGEWTNDWRSTVGIQYENSSRKEGEWSGDELTGFVVQLYPDGTRYAGEWAHGTADGYGVRIIPASASRVDGEWRSVSNTRASYVNGYAMFVSDSGGWRGIWRDGRLVTPIPF